MSARKKPGEIKLEVLHTEAIDPEAALEAMAEFLIRAALEEIDREARGDAA